MDVYLTRARNALRTTTGALTAEQIARPVEGRWSIGQILEHLTLSFQANAGALERAVASGATRARPPTVVQRLSRLVVIGLGYFPRAQAPEAVRPRGTVEVERSREAIDEALARLDAALVSAAELFGDNVPLLRHQYFGALTVRQWCRFHWRHTLHHLRQVRARARAAEA